MFILAATLSLLVCSTYSHTHSYFRPPRFFPSDPQPSLKTPTVNIFKIYAPRQIFLTGFKPEVTQQDFIPRDKQMMSSVSILDRILDDEMAQNEIVGEDPFFYNHFDEPFQPQPSNIMSRKLPPFAEPSFPVHPEFEHPVEMEVYPSAPMDDSTPRGFAAFIPNFIMDHEYCDHDHTMLHAVPHPMEDYDYPDLLAEIPDLGRAPSFNSHFRAPVLDHASVSPLLTFFESIAKNPNSDDSKFETEVMTSVTYGKPELVKESLADPDAVDLSEKVADLEDGENDEADSEAEDVVEINRNFIKTILPDNTSVTQEVQNSEIQSENIDELESNDEPVEEIEVNVVKTILPDNTYTVSEVITEDKIQKNTS